MTEKLTPRGPQEQIIQRIVNEPTKAFMLAGEPGAGKTFATCEVIARLWLDHGLIVGVKDTYRQWRNRLEAQTDGAHVLRKIDSTDAGQRAMADYLAGVKGFYFVGLQFATYHDHERRPQFNRDGSPKLDKNGQQVVKRVRLRRWEQVQPQIIVYDEGHMTSKRHNAGTNTMSGMKSEWRAYLSGTPFGNKFDNMHAPSMWLWPERTIASYPLWVQTWCRTDKVYVPGGRAVAKVVGEKNPGEYVKTLPCYVYWEAPVIDGKGAKVPDPEVITVPMTAEQMRVYLGFEEELLAWIKGHPVSVDWPVTLQSYLRLVALAEAGVEREDLVVDGKPVTKWRIHFDPDCASPKFDATRELLDGRWAGENVFILTHSRRWSQRLTQLLQSAGYDAEEYSGKQTAKQRDKIRERFARGELRVLVASTQATKLGLDGLQNACCKVLEHSIVVGDASGQEQAIRRIWRPGNPRISEFEYVRLAAEGTIESGLYARQDLQVAEQRRTLRLERGAA